METHFVKGQYQEPEFCKKESAASVFEIILLSATFPFFKNAVQRIACLRCHTLKIAFPFFLYVFRWNLWRLPDETADTQARSLRMFLKNFRSRTERPVGQKETTWSENIKKDRSSKIVFVICRAGWVKWKDLAAKNSCQELPSWPTERCIRTCSVFLSHKCKRIEPM